MPSGADAAVIVRFGDRGNAGPRLGPGWSYPELGWTWTVGEESTLRLPTPAKASDCVLQLHVYPHVTLPQVPRQRLAVLANGQTVGEFSITEDTTLQCRIPRDIVGASGTLEITFRHPDAMAPSAVSDVAEDRRLALAFRRCELFAAPPPVAPMRGDASAGDGPMVVVEFGSRGNAMSCLRSGWSIPEPGWQWTTGSVSSLELPRLPGQADCMLELQVHPHVNPPRVPEQRLTVVVNGDKLQDYRLVADATLQCRVPHRVAAKSDSLDIVFRHPDAAAPSTVAGLTEDRPLAIAFRRCRLFTLPAQIPAYESDYLVPPPELMFDGASSAADFKRIGEGFTRANLIERARLQPHESVLDLGSGNGQKARVLAYYLSPEGSYRGLDIVKTGIEWCSRRYAAFPNFRFDWADVQNSHYNPEGAFSDADYRLPYEEQSFDMIFASSLFTHMLSEGVANYIAEIGRLLRPAGRCVSTFFLLNDDVLERVEAGMSTLAFVHAIGDCRITDPDEPGLAVAHGETIIRQLFRASGMRTAELTFGNWSGGKELQGAVQDVLIAVKE